MAWYVKIWYAMVWSGWIRSALLCSVPIWFFSVLARVLSVAATSFESFCCDVNWNDAPCVAAAAAVAVDRLRGHSPSIRCGKGRGSVGAENRGCGVRSRVHAAAHRLGCVGLTAHVCASSAYLLPFSTAKKENSLLSFL